MLEATKLEPKQELGVVAINWKRIVMDLINKYGLLAIKDFVSPKAYVEIAKDYEIWNSFKSK